MNDDVSRLVLRSPLQGWVAPLDEVIDAVFSERMMGDGLAVDPVGSTLHAPFDGEIASLPETHHAVVVRAGCGAEVLIHIGLETVALSGEGFTAHVREGERVRSGDKLISFDLNVLAQRAPSLISPVVLTNSERFRIIERALDQRIAVGDRLMELTENVAGDESTAPSSDVQAEEARVRAIVAFPHGLHARPAATVARAAQRFASEIAVIARGRRANAKSPVSLMTLGVKEGDALVIKAQGTDAPEAVDSVSRAFAVKTGATPPRPKPERVPTSANAPPGEIRGISAAPGFATGVSMQVARAPIEVPEAGTGIQAETEALEVARTRVRARIDADSRNFDADPSRSAILAAHATLIDDPDIGAAALGLIEQGKSAGFAWRAAISDSRERLGRLDDAYLAERVADLADIEQQVLAELDGSSSAPARALPDDAILMADELLPSQLAAFDAAKVAGFCTAGGGPTSHVAILAGSMGIPALVAAGPRVLEIADGESLVIDGDAGILHIAPSLDELARAQAIVGARRQAAARQRAEARSDARTADGRRIAVYANLSMAAEAEAAVARGAEGCGLLRTELLFQDRTEPPDGEEQRALYQAVAHALGNRPLVIRTLDVGGDKPVAFLPMAKEDNPALGLRGIRVSRAWPDLLRIQLSAISRVEPRPRVMLPMVTDAGEVEDVRKSLSEFGDLELGAMIETPSAAMLADQIARVADFLSLGTNDLAQYTLAMDRGHPGLASSIDALHPAVLRLIAKTVEGGRAHGRPVSVCGATAADPLAAPLLIGLGVDALSVPPAAIPVLKEQIRRVRFDDCVAAAEQALVLPSADQVRAWSSSRFGDSRRSR